MEKLTKEQRHEVYKMALSIYKEEWWTYACESIRSALINLHGESYSVFYNEIYEHVPEFVAKKPVNAGILWWGTDREARITALTQCIEETKP